MERNAPYMAKSCPLTCSQCSRNATLEVGVDGSVVAGKTDLHTATFRTRSGSGRR